MTDVHPAAHVGPGVELGVGVTVSPGAVLVGPARIGDHVWIGPHAAVGTPAQMRGGPHPGVDGPADGAGVEIGSGCVVREFTTVHQGTAETTRVGRDCYLMAYAHVPHDAWIGDGCTLSNSVQLGGHTWVGDGANLGLGAVVHQFGVVGPFAMVGMQSAVTRPVPPFAMAMGLPARVTGVNAVGYRRLHGDASVVPAGWAERLRAGEVVGADAGDVAAAVVAAYDAALDRSAGWSGRAR